MSLCLFPLYTVRCLHHAVIMNFASDKASFFKVQKRYKLKTGWAASNYQLRVEQRRPIRLQEL